MKILLSPAKTLDYKTELPTTKNSIVLFESHANILNKVLYYKTPKQLAKIMHISDKLSELNWQRNQDWKTTKEHRQAVYAFKGTAYVGLDAHTISDDKIDYLQNTLRILSGQYGILKPLDLIKPYRLEMGSKLVFDTHKNLYDFWDNKVTEVLNKEMHQDEVLINLASNEYFKVISPKLLKSKIITPIFKDYKNGQYKVISFYAKKARGIMTRFAVDNQIENPQQLKTFSKEGYGFDDKLSTKTEWVFTR
jgi:cytoplasmic iron level regulating protein YaaA (DUF328/UPF0246 family)